MGRNLFVFVFLTLIVYYTSRSEARVCHPIEALYGDGCDCDPSQNVEAAIISAKIPSAVDYKAQSAKFKSTDTKYWIVVPQIDAEIPKQKESYDYKMKVTEKPIMTEGSYKMEFEYPIITQVEMKTTEDKMSEMEKVKKEEQTAHPAKVECTCDKYPPGSEMMEPCPMHPYKAYSTSAGVAAAIAPMPGNEKAEYRVPVNFYRYDESSKSQSINNSRRKRDLSKQIRTNPSANTRHGTVLLKANLKKRSADQESPKDQSAKNYAAYQNMNQYQGGTYNVEGMQYMPEIALPQYERGQYSCYTVPVNGNQQQIVCHPNAPPEMAAYNPYSNLHATQSEPSSVPHASTLPSIDATPLTMQAPAPTATPTLPIAATQTSVPMSASIFAATQSSASIPTSTSASNSASAQSPVESSSPTIQIPASASTPQYLDLNSLYLSAAAPSVLPAKQVTQGRSQLLNNPNSYYNYDIAKSWAAKNYVNSLQKNIVNNHETPAAISRRNTDAYLSDFLQQVLLSRKDFAESNNYGKIPSEEDQRTDYMAYMQKLLTTRPKRYEYDTNRNSMGAIVDPNGYPIPSPNKYKIIPVGGQEADGSYLVKILPQQKFPSAYTGNNQPNPTNPNVISHMANSKIDIERHEEYRPNDKAVPINEEFSS